MYRVLRQPLYYICTMKLIKGEFKEKLDLLYAPSIKAGFPSPAEDYLSDSLDFNRDLIKHPEATFYAVVDGDSMTGLGINPGDIAVIDKSLEPSHGDIVVSYINEEFNIKQLDLTHQIISRCGVWWSIRLRSGNSACTASLTVIIAT